MTPGSGRRVLYLLFGSVVPVRRAREFDTRNRIYVPGIVLLENCCVAVSTPDPALEPGAFRTFSQAYPDSSLLEQALHAQSQTHVARDA
jgi:hypothetical protein